MQPHSDQHERHPYPYLLWPGYRRRYRGKKEESRVAHVFHHLLPAGWFQRLLAPAEGGFINFTATMRARGKRGRGPKRPPAGNDVRRLYDSQDGRCFYCGGDLNGAFRIDHKTPLGRGGTDARENLCCACEVCSRQKGMRTADEYKSYLRSFRRSR